MPEVAHSTLTDTALNVQSAMPSAAPTTTNIAYILNNTNAKAVLVATGTASVSDWVVFGSQPTGNAGDPNGSITALFEFQQIVDTSTEPPTWYYAQSSDVGTTTWTALAASSSGGSGAPYAVPGTPEFWINSQTGVTESSFVVSEVLDQSASSNDLTYSGNTSPTIEAGAYNSLNAVNFDDTLGSGGVAITTSNSTDWTIIFAADFKVGTFTLLQGDFNTNQIIFSATNNQLSFIGMDSGQVDADPFFGTGLAIYSILLTADNIEVFKNGGSSSYSTSTNTQSAYSWDNVFVSVGGTGSPNTSLADMIIFPSVISDADHNAIGNALDTLYNLSEWASVDTSGGGFD